MGTGTRIQFSDSDRIQICKLQKANPTLSHEKLTDHATRQLDKPGLATFMADNPQFTAKDEMTLQAVTDKVARMVVARVNHQKQQSISNYFPTI